ncbi:ABC transporter ATP-binding protein [bacterium]|nr:ABC transporter ATP-binding protein [bacterium]
MKEGVRIYLSLLNKYIMSYWKSIVFGLVLGIVSQICTLVSPLITKFLMDFVIVGKNYSYFKPLILISIGILIILLFSSLLSSYILIKTFKQILIKLKLDIFKNLQFAPISFYKKESSGGISYRLHSDTELLVNSWKDILVQIPMQIILLISAIFMIKWNLTLALFTFIILTIQAYIIARFRNPILNYAKKVRIKNQTIRGYTVEHFRRIQLVRSLGTEKHEQGNFLKKLTELVKWEIKTFMITKFSNILQILISNIWSLSIIFYGGILVIQNKMTVGTLMAFLMFTGILYRPISSFTNLILSFQSIRVSLARVKEYLEIKPQVIERPDAIDFIPKEGKIVVENVSFSYDTKKVLFNISVEFPPNSITAIIGPTGSGKTTLAKLMVRFFDPDEGRILLDGVDIKDIKLSCLRKHVIFFLHENYVFNGTLYENITYGVNNVSYEELNNALKDASIDFIDKLPYGLDTIIGEDGINLSSGEAQRVALARAFLLSPKVFIFDEPTSDIDLETEKKIKRSILRLKEKSNIIIIAHRPPTYMIADRILYLENGRIKNHF